MNYTHERDKCLFCGMRAEVIAPTLWQCTSCRMTWKDIQIPRDDEWGDDDVEEDEAIGADEELQRK